MPKQLIIVKAITDLEDALGYEFKNKELLRKSLTHASAMNEEHPIVFNRAQSSLAFVGDSVLKYAVARYLFLNGQDHVVDNPAELHKGTQTVIPNSILADIAREKLHLEEYIIRGNSHKILSTRMYADCMEAILGAIALDCGTNQQEVVFRVIEKLFSDRYETLLKPVETSRFMSVDGGYEDKVVPGYRHLMGRLQQRPGSQKPLVLYKSHERSHLQTLGLLVLLFFAICGFSVIVWKIIDFTIFQSPASTKTQRHEL